MDFLSFYRGKKVLITGHTGFKGSWLVRMLLLAGADVYGYALAPPTHPALFDILGLKKEMRSENGDVRDYDHLLRFLGEVQPEYVFHLAAQPIVRTSYRYPRETFETNVMGTVNLLEAVRHTKSVRSVVNVTTDKVYENRETRHPYREDEPLDGFDPYSNSKSCSDLVTHSYRSSFFEKDGPAVSTARAGNVIGGGDFADCRIIPDCFRAASTGQEVILRNPASVRPYQHVLEPLSAYLLLAMREDQDPRLQGAYNVGPDTEDAVTTGEIADLFIGTWGNGASWRAVSDGGPHEAGLLLLDSTKIRETLGWKPVWHIGEAVQKAALWYRIYADGGDMAACTESQIREYISASRKG